MVDLKRDSNRHDAQDWQLSCHDASSGIESGVPLTAAIDLFVLDSTRQL